MTFQEEGDEAGADRPAVSGLWLFSVIVITLSMQQHNFPAVALIFLISNCSLASPGSGPSCSPVIGLMANFLTTPPGLLPKLGSPSTHRQPQQVLSFKGNISYSDLLGTSS